MALLFLFPANRVVTVDDSVSVGSGVAKPNDFRVEARYWTGIIRARPASTPLAFDVEVGCWTHADESSSVDEKMRESTVYRRKGSDLHLGLNMLLEAKAEGFWASAGLGIGPHAVKSEVYWSTTSYCSGIQSSDDHYNDTKTGIHALAGLEFRLHKRLSMFGSARYDLLKGAAQNEIEFHGGLRYIVLTRPRPARASYGWETCAVTRTTQPPHNWRLATLSTYSLAETVAERPTGGVGDGPPEASTRSPSSRKAAKLGCEPA